ncbi:hypothetical protein NUU61_000448 [Penicillium alfredii]|uniref:SET domain-containing protein n=1 Tax=Penicillium alfredii TaxID=1506179 RepID=A0A9W9KPR1_9EURO|nr:uncharacterized protein NUU61_000448 [Penicillium alfredii]KAJ5114689.1 hypothetical protein NUU61_000448 [Penicillium alfredii]
MKPDWWPGEDHATFTEWALSQGVVTNGVTPARFSGRGLGMITTRNITSGETLLRVPVNVMLTADHIPSSFIEKFPEDIGVQTLFAAFLTHGTTEYLAEYEPWRKCWPSRRDFEDGMPILWPAALGGPKWPGNGDDDDAQQDQAGGLPNSLPPCISGLWNSFQKTPTKEYETYHQNLLAQQVQRLRKAWTDVVSVFPDTDWNTFSYHWLIVNTRSFYWVGPDQDTPEDRNDAMALVPFADYFNHSDVACDVEFDDDGYLFRASKNYEPGEEVFMSYGSHPNDFLFAEYGFFLDENGSDTVYLDDIIFRDINRPQLRDELWENQYYGNYQVTLHGACYRTEVAACLKYMNEEDWRNHVLEGSSQGLDENKSEATIKDWIQNYAMEAEMAIATLQAAMETNTVVREHRSKAEMLLRRWQQIKDLCGHAAQAVSV